MNAPHPNGKSNGKDRSRHSDSPVARSAGADPPATLDGFPLPQALWAAVDRDPDAVMALLWALDRLVSRKPKPSVCYPGSCDCPFCHPDYRKLTAGNR